MTYQPTLQDAALDLWRCVYASFGKETFDSPSFKGFFNNGLAVISSCRGMLDPRRLGLIEDCLNRAQKEDLEPNKRREDILTAAVLLKSA